MGCRRTYVLNKKNKSTWISSRWTVFFLLEPPIANLGKNSRFTIERWTKYDLPPTKMSIKYAPYLHHKSDNWALNMVLLYALLRILLTKFVLNFLCYAICPKYHFVHYYRKLVQIRC